MATPVVVTLVLVAVGTLLAVVLLIIGLARRASRAARELSALQARIGPELEALQRDAAVTRLELARLEATRATPASGPPPVPPDLGR